MLASNADVGRFVDLMCPSIYILFPYGNGKLAEPTRRRQLSRIVVNVYRTRRIIEAQKKKRKTGKMRNWTETTSVELLLFGVDHLGRSSEEFPNWTQSLDASIVKMGRSAVRTCAINKFSIIDSDLDSRKKNTRSLQSRWTVLHD